LEDVLQLLFSLLCAAAIISTPAGLIWFAFRRSAQSQRGRSLALFYVWLCVLSPGCCCVVLPVMSRSIPITPSRRCRAYLKELQVRLTRYANEHGGIFPAQLSGLYPSYSDLWPVEWWHPPKGSRDMSPRRHETARCYTYTPGLHLTSPAHTIVLRDSSPSEHDGTGWYSISVGGEIRWHWTPLGRKRRTIYAAVSATAWLALTAAAVLFAAPVLPRGDRAWRPAVQVTGVALAVLSWLGLALTHLWLAQTTRGDQVVWLPNYGKFFLSTLAPAALLAAYSIRVWRRLPIWEEGLWRGLGGIGVAVCAIMFSATWLTPIVSTLPYAKK